jgi:hypothetical protein
LFAIIADQAVVARAADDVLDLDQLVRACLVAEGLARRQIDRDACRLVGIVGRVDAIASIEQVVVGATGEDIVAAAAEQRVIAGAALEHVVAVLAVEDIVALAAIDRIVAGTGRDRIVTRTRKDRVVAGGADEIVVEFRAEDRAGLRALENRVLADIQVWMRSSSTAEVSATS